MEAASAWPPNLWAIYGLCNLALALDTLEKLKRESRICRRCNGTGVIPRVENEMKRAMTRDEALESIAASMQILGVDETMVLKQIRRGCYLGTIAFHRPPVALENISTPSLRQLAGEIGEDVAALEKEDQ